MAQETFKRTNTSTANKKVFTYSFWMKGNDIVTGNQARPIYNYDGSTLFQLMIERSTNNNPGYWVLYANGTEIRWEGKRIDPSAWYHVVLSANTTRTRDVDRVVFYIDGVRMNVLGSQTGSPGTPTYPSLNLELYSGVNYINGIAGNSKYQLTDFYYVDGQALDGDVFGFNKEGNGYSSVGSTLSEATDFRPGQWSPHSPRRIKTEIERRGGFGANGYYLPMNDSSNPGADFHCTPNSIIKLKGEDLPQPRNGAPTTSDAYVSQLREESVSGGLPFEGVVRFGGDGTSSSLKFPNHSDFDLGGSPFTIECWIYPIDASGSSYAAIFNKGYGFQVYWKSNIEALQLYGTDSASGQYNMMNGVTTPDGSVPKGRWTHIVVTREPGNNTWKMYTNGKLTYGPLVVSGSLHSNSNDWTIGDYGPSPGAYEFKGFISDFRLVVGSAVYTSNFTPPTTRLTNITNTKLLCCQSSTSATEAAVAPTTGGTAGGANTFATKNELTGSISIAVPGISTATGQNLLTNGGFDTDLSGWTTVQATTSWHQGMLRIVPNVAVNGGVYQEITTVVGKRYTVSMEVVDADPISNPPSPYARLHVGTSNDINSGGKYLHTGSSSVSNVSIGKWTTSFTATTTYTIIWLEVGGGNQTRVDFDNVVCKQEDAPRDYSADIRGSGTNLTLIPSGNPGVGYELDGYYGSAMNFNATNIDEINVDGSTNNEDLQLKGEDFTIEAWLNPRAYNSGNMDWIGKNSGATATCEFEYGILSTGVPTFYHGDGSAYSSTGNNGVTLAADTIPIGQWTHVATERNGDRLTVYINGVPTAIIESFLGGGSMPSGAANLCLGNDSATSTNDWHWDGRIQDLRIYKGVAKYKGGFDVSKPYAPRGIESWRTTPDTPTNNFATLNHLSYQTTGTYGTHKPVLTNGNLTLSKAANGHWERSHATFGVGEGKWYYEFMAVDRPKAAGAVGENWAVGVRESDSRDFFKETDGYEDIGDHVYWADAGTPRIVSNQDRSAGFTSGDVTAAADGDIINVAFQKTATGIRVWFGINGTYFVGNPSTETSPIISTNSTSRFLIPSAAAYCYAVQNPAVFEFNFGQNQSFSGRTTAGTNTDSNGKGMFKYPVPTGFLSICEDNLPTPTIPDPGKHFKTVLWTGDGKDGRSITDVGFKPDLVWIKPRNFSDNHVVFDSITKTALYANTNGTGNNSRVIWGYDSSGFTMQNWNNINDPGDKFVAWCWKAGGKSIKNTNGAITSDVSVNETAGFSIVRYIGNGNVATVGHGLPKAPSFILSKNRENNYGWPIYHKSTQNTGSSATDVVYLNETTVGNADNIRSVNDTTFQTTNWGGINYGGKEHIAYCWTEIEGFSRFSSYLGNGSNDGPFVYCGFRPAYVIIKNVSATGEWCIWDSSRTPHNEMQYALRSNSADGDVDGFQFDFLCNGFKARDTESSVNTNGSRYIFAAFAESPFKTANAR